MPIFRKPLTWNIQKRNKNSYLRLVWEYEEYHGWLGIDVTLKVSARNHQTILINFSKLSKKIKYSESTCFSLQYSLRYCWLLYLVRCLLIDKFPQLLFIPHFHHNQRSLKLPPGKRNSFIAAGDDIIPVPWAHFVPSRKIYTVYSVSACPRRIIIKPIKMWYINITFKIKALNDSFSKRFIIIRRCWILVFSVLICSLWNIMKIHKFELWVVFKKLT